MITHSHTDHPPERPILFSATENAILDLLRGGASMRRITAVGRYRRAWTARDIARVIDAYSGSGTSDRLLWRPPGYVPTNPFTGPPPVDVEITVRTATVIEALSHFESDAVIGDHLGVRPGTIRRYRSDITRAFGASSFPEALRLARAGRVRLFIVDRIRRDRPARGREKAA